MQLCEKKNFLVNLYLFDSIISEIFRIYKLQNCWQNCLLNNASYGNEKKTLFQLLKQQYWSKLPLIKLNWRDKFYARKNVATSKKVNFQKKGQKVENNFCIFMFKLQPHPINYKTCKGSWNFVIMTLGDFSMNATYMFWGKVCHSILKQINHQLC